MSIPAILKESGCPVSQEPGVVSALSSIRYVRRVSWSLSAKPSLVTRTSEGWEDLNSSILEVHWTVRVRMTLTLEQLGLFAETLVGEIIKKQNMSMEDYLILSEIFFRIKPNNRNFHLRRLYAVLRELLDLSVDPVERTERILSIYEHSGSDLFRIYGSRRKTWLPKERFFQILSVPVETYLDQRGSGQPYSSYCKGYGEGSGRGPKKTPYSAELDGKDETPGLDRKILKLLSHLINLLFAEKRNRSFRQN